MLSYPRHDPHHLDCLCTQAGRMERWNLDIGGLQICRGLAQYCLVIIIIIIALVFHGMSQSVVMWSREQSGFSTLRSLRWHPCTMRRWQAVNNRYLNLSFWVNSERCSLTAGRHNAITAAELNAMLVENSTAVSSSTRQDVSTNKLLVLKQILHYLIYNMIWEDKVGVFKVGD